MALAIVKSVVKRGREGVPYQEIVQQLELGSMPAERPPITLAIEGEEAEFRAHFSVGE